MVPQRTRLLGQAEHTSAVHPLCTVIHCTHHPPLSPKRQKDQTLTDTSRKGRRQTVPQGRQNLKFGPMLFTG